jgi:hypothetical protein
MKQIAYSAVLLLLATSAQAITLSADADAFTAGTDISNGFAGLTLSFEGTTSFGITDGIIYSVEHSGSLVATTGTRVFGTSDPTYPNLFSGTTTSVFRVDFSSDVYSVALDALGDDPTDFAELYAYNSSDVLLGTYSTAVIATGQSETMSVSGGDIAYVLAAGISNSAVGFDNLTAETVPLPAAVWMFLSALGALGFRRRLTSDANTN